MNPVVLKIYILKPKTGIPAIFVPHGQTVSFGRRETADICCDFDGRISSIHFEIEHKGDVVEIRDLRSASGTWLNKELVDRATLRNGDIVRAGQTLFGVRLEESGTQTMEIQSGENA